MNFDNEREEAVKALVRFIAICIEDGRDAYDEVYEIVEEAHKQ